MSRRKRARLLLEDGAEFEGWAFGAAKSIEGEVVFTTGMSGYPQSLTDPSYFGQILVNTYPLVGNYGVPDDALDDAGIPLHFESSRIWVSGLVVSEVAAVPSHHASVRSLPAWMESQGVPGIEGIDTRALTMRLRERGVMRGSIRVDGASSEPAPELESAASSHPVASVSRKEAAVYGAGGFPRIALLDCGAKNNILRSLLSRGAELQVLPWNASLEGREYDGVFLSNGPGDPKACTRTIATVRRALAGDKPVFGICLGAQIMALAAGGDTYKLPYGHRGQNQPCVDVSSGRCYITSQNHGYAVSADSLPGGWELWFTNGNDGTVEGIRSTRGPFSAVQFHPEGCPGPRDTEFLFDAFLAQARERAGKAAVGTREPELAMGPSLEARHSLQRRLAR
jgi:carbamoyl-phosphate synthase small subunit